MEYLQLFRVAEAQSKDWTPEFYSLDLRMPLATSTSQPSRRRRLASQFESTTGIAATDISLHREYTQSWSEIGKMTSSDKCYVKMILSIEVVKTF